jgi:hypothetical protein
MNPTFEKSCLATLVLRILEVRTYFLGDADFCWLEL